MLADKGAFAVDVRCMSSCHALYHITRSASVVFTISSVALFKSVVKIRNRHVIRGDISAAAQFANE